MLIPFGKITKTHGLSGEVRLQPLSRRSHNLILLERIFITGTKDSEPTEIKIIKAREHKDSAIVRLEGIGSIAEAEQLVNMEVYVEDGDLEDLEEDEYYWFELIGLEVYTDGGDYIGKVEDLMDRSFQSILIIRNEEKEVLIPLTEPFIDEIDLDKARIVISPIDGLIE